jgi:dual specificity protein kinase YAK1
MLTCDLASRSGPPQLPPIQSTMSPDTFFPQSATIQLNNIYGRDAKSPRSNQPQAPTSNPRGSVPKFQKCLNINDLEPNVNEHPPFRRANPEGGFISVGRVRRFSRGQG